MKDLFVCIECGFESAKWMGKCTSCGAWNTFKIVDQTKEKSKKGRSIEKAKIEKIDIKSARISSKDRLSTGFLEFDRVLGGGLVKGEVILIGGEPGIGKTTLLLELLYSLQNRKIKCLYVSAEESVSQIALHAKRLSLSGSLDFIGENDIDSVLSSVSSDHYDCIVVDSIQTVKTDDLGGVQGGVGQVKECAARITEFAKKTSTIVFMIGHITKEGDVAGPKVLEHIVDCVLFLEGDATNSFRILRSIKNRFGSTKEVGVFNFSMSGLSDSKNPAETFILSDSARIGACKGVIFEGSRALLVEIQSLISSQIYNIPRRISVGFPRLRLEILSAVIAKYTKTKLYNKDVFVNVANGLKLDDPSTDLSAAISMISSFHKVKVQSDLIAIGEVSLSGQLHANLIDIDKLKSVSRLGYKNFIAPKSVEKYFSGLKCYFADSIIDVEKYILR